MNFQDDRCWLPLHYAAKRGFLEVVKWLVKSSANLTMTCTAGQMPICLAASAGHEQELSLDLGAFDLMQNKVFLTDLITSSKQHANRPMREFILINDQALIDVAVKLAKCFQTLIEKHRGQAGGRKRYIRSCRCRFLE